MLRVYSYCRTFVKLLTFAVFPNGSVHPRAMQQPAQLHFWVRTTYPESDD